MVLKRKAVQRDGRVLVTEKILRSLSLGRVLELGAGDYSFSYVADSCTPSDRWVTADFALPCDLCCDLNQSSPRIPVEDDTFDTIICTEVLEHLLWPQAVLEECQRILKPKGRLIVSVPNMVSLTFRLRWVFGEIPAGAASGNLPKELGNHAYEQEDGILVGGHVVDFNRLRLSQLLELCGYRVQKTCGSGITGRYQWLPHWIVPVELASAIVMLARIE